MPSYQQFTSTRTTEPDPTTLISQLRALDATAGVQHQPGTQVYTIKKATAWTAPQISAAQNVIDTAPASTPALTAQGLIAQLSIVDQALVLIILDQFNAVRSKLDPPLAALTNQQLINAWIAKAGTL